jgi:hypothetical protein
MDEEEAESKFISDKDSEESFENKLENDDAIARKQRHGGRIR